MTDSKSRTAITNSTVDLRHDSTSFNMIDKWYVILDFYDFTEYLKKINYRYLSKSVNILQVDDDPKRLFAKTYDCNRYFNQEELFYFLVFDKEEVDLSSTLVGKNTAPLIERIECSVCEEIGVIGIGPRLNAENEVRKHNLNIQVVEHPNWYKTIGKGL